MTAILITGYRSFELGIFDPKDQRISIIKKAIRKDLIGYLQQGVDWFIFTGNLGFEQWALEVANELKKDYPLQVAAIFPFETHGHNWNAKNQEVLSQFKAVDFVKYSFPMYKNPQQFSRYHHFLLANTDGAYIFYDSENETNLKYLVAKMKDLPHYDLSFLTFDRLNEIVEE
ncbi:UNVERIFIED_CONTAM: DUF1273 domain-containing protein [Streptococcus canis]|uniref:UPF0398 protein KB584_07965 n=2 Tax=Streptococcus canis TaxID=1329 RepID=A0AAE4Q5L6_STRCB|nr:DUF1273 domain-containing protein [Streptococcus canis]EIQ82462.1 hypothetical protein SCAZ3_08885 [Streptococcus canis FSL Z3-227]MDV5973754.1 DUF1273 domain-containing protein [Streptococcus canis]MDV5977390.1 DUF1273 domain-containing protein [Streptococcus canis]MDV5988813.1 DUF1273 domain-containing protein [Streptococcus canis]MDV5994100.1 DUF1273 domain-containing protein [Streptococcus canis]